MPHIGAKPFSACLRTCRPSQDGGAKLEAQALTKHDRTSTNMGCDNVDSMKPGERSQQLAWSMRIDGARQKDLRLIRSGNSSRRKVPETPLWLHAALVVFLPETKPTICGNAEHTCAQFLETAPQCAQNIYTRTSFPSHFL